MKIKKADGGRSAEGLKDLEYYQYNTVSIPYAGRIDTERCLFWREIIAYE